MKFLEIAGSRVKPGWDNIRDIPVRGSIQHDMRKLPIPGIDDGTYDGTYSEHFIEHLTKEEGINFLKEMHRILKPNATIRIVWPSMDLVDRLNKNPTNDDILFANLYNRNIMVPENVFSKPYYRQFTNVNISSMDVLQRAAFRLLHQEGEHKHLWYEQELIDILEDIGFKNARKENYQSSRLTEFNNIDSREQMRTLHSSVVEATK